MATLIEEASWRSSCAALSSNVDAATRACLIWCPRFLPSKIWTGSRFLMWSWARLCSASLATVIDFSDSLSSEARGVKATIAVLQPGRSRGEPMGVRPSTSLLLALCCGDASGAKTPSGVSVSVLKMGAGELGACVSSRRIVPPPLKFLFHAPLCCECGTRVLCVCLSSSPPRSLSDLTASHFAIISERFKHLRSRLILFTASGILCVT